MTGPALASLRPKDETASSVTAAIAAVAAERQSAERRLAEARAARALALVDTSCTTKRVALIEASARELEIQLERLDLLAPALAERLTEARRAEGRAEADRCVGVAHAAVEAYRVALGEYPELAKRIAAICLLGRQAAAAIQRSAHVGGRAAFDWPGAVNIADLVLLPTPDGGATYWGRFVPPQPVVRY